MEMFTHDIGYMLNKIAFKLKSSLNRLLREKGYTTTAEQFEIIMILHGGDVSFTQTEIAEFTSKTKTNITRMLDAMERHDLIKRMKHESDRRAYRIVVTEKGKEEAVKINQLISEFQRRLTSLLGQQDITELLRILNKIDRYIP